MGFVLKLALFAALLTLLIISGRQVVKATLESCSASITPNTMQTSSVENFTVTLTNTGSSPVLYFDVSAPNSNFSIQGKDAAGWSGTSNSSLAQFWGGSLGAGQTMNFTLSVLSGTSEALSANWVVRANDVLSSDGTTTCTGSLGVAIEGIRDVAAPVISEAITVTNITASSATLNWTTNEPATSRVEYGLSVSDLALTYEEVSLSSSHTVTLTTGIAASTTYYYRVCSTDAAGNQACGDENLFTTAAASIATPTPTPTPTPAASSSTSSTSVTSSAVPKATPAPESVPPVVSVLSNLETSYEVAPVIEGIASDNIGVIKVEYSTDGGINWLPADVDDIGAKNVQYSFQPNLPEDGNYELVVRAVDAVGNIGVTESFVLVIDRLPPRVGGNLLSMGPHALLPGKNGVITAMVGVEQKITLSTVGGPVTVDLIARIVAGEDNGGESMFSLGRSVETGLWNGAIFFRKSGIYEITARALDGAGNETERVLGLVNVYRSGKVYDSVSGEPITEGEITVHYRDPQSRIWTKWDSKTYGQNNPQVITETGNYKLFLVPGTYYIDIKSPGRERMFSKIFTLSSSTPFNADFSLKLRRTISIGPFTISIPQIFTEKHDVVLNASLYTGLSTNFISGDSLSGFNLPTSDGGVVNSDNLKGAAHVVSFVNTWSPQSVEQIALVDQAYFQKEINGVFVVTQEDAARVKVFTNRGGYGAIFGVDRDGELVEEYGLSSVPVHYFMSSSGIVEKVVVGVLSKEEMRSEIESIN